VTVPSSSPTVAPGPPVVGPGLPAPAVTPNGPSVGPEAPTHACVRCGAPVAIDVGLCERCNPLGLRDVSASQVHGVAFIGVAAAVIVLAIVARLSVSGVGPFVGSVTGAADGTGLALTLTVTNKGTNSGQTTCRVTDPADRTGAAGAIVLSPRVDPGQTRTFITHVTELGSAVRSLDVACAAP